MKKKNGKRPIIGIILLSFLMIVLTSCGNDKKGEEKTLNKTNVSKQEQPEDGYVYQASFQDIEIPCTDISSSCMYDGRIYMVGSKYEDGETEDDYTYTVYFLSCNLDGSDMKQKKLDFKETEFIEYMGIDQEENLRLVTMRYDYNEKTGSSKSQAFLYTIDKEGTIIDTCKLKSKDKGNFYIGTAYMAGDTLYTSGNKKIYTFNMKGKPEKTYDFGSSISAMAFTEEGFYAYGYGGKGDNDSFIMKGIDTKTGEVGKPVDFGDYRINDATLCTRENAIYMNDSNNVYCFDTKTKEVTTLFNWINSDINSNNIKNYFPLSDEEFLVLSYSYENNEGKVEIANIKKVKASTVREKTVLRLACANTDDRIKKNIISFNKENKDYRVELDDYSHYENPAMQLGLDINSGKIPDILCIESLPVSQYIQKGLLTDLYPFMEKDEEVNKEDFIDSICQATERDGKLYFMGSAFTMQSLIGSKKNLGDMEALTFSEMKKLYDSVPENGEFMRMMTKNNFITTMLSERLEDYIDWNTGEISFDSQEFIDLLEFANRFPKEIDEEHASKESTPTMVEKGTLMLDNLYIYGLDNIQMYAKMYKKAGGFQAIAYPSKTGNTGLSISFNGVALAITEQCKEKNGAWEFVRLFLTYKNQKSDSSYYGGMPTRKDAMEKALEYAAATKKYTDEDGTVVRPNNITIGFDDYTVDIGPLTKKEIETVRSMLNRISKCIAFDAASEEINKIIEEEAQAYFAGDKTAQEAAGLIQNRVKLYVSENS